MEDLVLQIQIIKFYAISIHDKDSFSQITTPPGAYEVKNLNNEIKRNFTVEEQFTEAYYPLTNKPKFSNLSSIVGISKQKPLIEILPNDFIGIFSGLMHLHYMKNITHHLIPSTFYHLIKIFECDIAQFYDGC